MKQLQVVKRNQLKIWGKHGRQKKELHRYVKRQIYLKNKLMSWRNRSRVSLRRQREGIKENIQDIEVRRRNIKIWITEVSKGEVKINEKGNI